MSFSGTIAEWAEEAQVNADKALRAASLELLRRAVLRSPVGNPELWAANKKTLETRKSAVAEATAAGKRISKRTLLKNFPLHTGKGYVGGRFRGNWFVTLESPAIGATDTVDPSGSQTIAAGAEALAQATYGATIFMVNNLPYSEVLEYGHSRQAPAGVVRVTAAEFQGIVNDVVSSLK